MLSLTIQTGTLGDIYDTYLSFKNKTTIYGTATTTKLGWEYVGTRGEDKMRLPLKTLVEGSALLPSAPKAKLHAATLQLLVASKILTGSMAVTAYQCDRDWNEAAAHWNQWDVVQPWSTAGGDYSSPPSKSFTIPNAIGSVSTDFLAFVSAAYAVSYGYVNTLILADNEGVGVNTTQEVVTIDSSEFATTGLRPALTVWAEKRHFHGAWSGSYKGQVCS